MLEVTSAYSLSNDSALEKQASPREEPSSSTPPPKATLGMGARVDHIALVVPTLPILIATSGLVFAVSVLATA